MPTVRETRLEAEIERLQRIQRYMSVPYIEATEAHVKEMEAELKASILAFNGINSELKQARARIKDDGAVLQRIATASDSVSIDDIRRLAQLRIP